MWFRNELSSLAEISLWIIEKYPNIKCHEILSSNSQVDHVEKWVDRQTDGHDEANSYILQYCEQAHKSARM